jgi:hypothetical protein
MGNGGWVAGMGLVVGSGKWWVVVVVAGGKYGRVWWEEGGREGWYVEYVEYMFCILVVLV